MRSLALVVLCLMISGCAVRKTPAEISPDRVIRFHENWQQFFRTYFGCPPYALRVEECEPTRGMIDLKSFEKARDIGLFDRFDAKEKKR
jgi:hypothetical protein